MRTAPTPEGLWGVYDHRHQLITMRPGLAVAQYRSTLAHELGHAHFGHEGHSSKAERQADRWAARQLLTIDLIVEKSAMAIDTGELAYELEVLPWVIRTFVGGLDSIRTGLLLERVRAARI